MHKFVVNGQLRDRVDDGPYHPSEQNDAYLSPDCLERLLLQCRGEYGSADDLAALDFVLLEETLHARFVRGEIARSAVNEQLSAAGTSFRDQFGYWAHHADAYRRFYELVSE